MRKIAKQIIDKTTIGKNEDIEAIIEFIAAPGSVDRMITATMAGKPALAGIVKEIRATVWRLQRYAVKSCRTRQKCSKSEKYWLDRQICNGGVWICTSA